MGSSLTDKVALITGGAGGIGSAIARHLRDEGASVVISDVCEERVVSVAEDLRVDHLQQDTTEETRWVEVVNDIEQRYGRLNILINNAALLNDGPANDPENTSLQDWQRMFQVNVDGTFLGCKAGIGAMRRAGGGVIVNMSSIAGLQAHPRAYAYAVSKAAVCHMTKSVAEYCALECLNIRCNSVHPGYVLTEPWVRHAEGLAEREGVSVDTILKRLARDVPIGEFTTPDEVAGAVGFLCSPSGKSMLGAQLVIDGGIVNCDTFHSPRNQRG